MSKYYSAGERLATYADLQTVQGEIQTIQSDMPTKVSDLENDLDYTELSYIDSLPASGEENVIYLLETEDGLIQYVYKNDEWVPLGNENQAIILPRTVYDITGASTSAQIVNALGGQSNIDKLIAGLSQHAPVFVAYSETLPSDFTPTGDFCPVGLSTYGDSAGNLKIFLTIYIRSLQTREIGLESNINNNYTIWHCLSVSTETFLSTTNTYAYEPTANYHPATKKYVDDTIASTMSAAIKREIVQALPVSDIKIDTIYMVPSSDPGTQNVYDEYMYINNAWEKIGSTDIDLTNYATKEYVNNKSTLFLSGTMFAIDTSDTSEYIVAKLGGQTVADAIIQAINTQNRFIAGVSTFANQYANAPVFITSVEEDNVKTIMFECTMQGLLPKPRIVRIVLTYASQTGTWTCIEASYYELSSTDYVETKLGEIRTTSMSEPTSSDVGTIIQYVGETNEYYTTGHFYTVVEQSNSGVPTYVWQEVVVQGESVDASDDEALSDLISEGTTGETVTVYVENFGPNGDYTGYVSIKPTSETGADYSYLDGNETIYGHMESSIDPETGDTIITHSNIVEGAKLDEVVRQVTRWSLLDDNNTWQNNHAVYEDFQWLLNEWKTKYNSTPYYVPNFSVDGYWLGCLYEYNSSSINDYKRYCLYFTTLINNRVYYYTVYFYAHYYNNTVYDETSNYKASKSYSSSTFLTSHQSLANYLAKNNTTSFTPTGDYNPATKKYVDDITTALETEMGEAIAEASIQVDTLPEPTSSNVGDIYQYTGPDTQDLDHGHFYQVVENAGSGIPVYSYQDIGITTGVTTAVVPQEITDVTYGAYRRYPGYSDTGLQLLQNNNGQLIWGQTVNSIWIGTQQEYDALPEHFDTMVYFIKEDE